ncbi:TPA: lipid asymmetry maintenance protein MlaB [Providencia rettgeri]|uniref:lipid asymmetry maintenance protein MlaB n=1 Tax=Providencia TaxID=586 RepID=UPI001B35BF75|nr:MULTISPECIES: lipid asymmetry maintenance protein MlaB [Providencia]EMB5785792.1 lipid asymmetry maintenance protein MlaB [Providencia rettgeri]MBQ0365472.1 lipid asymmetry maintenance protein MlaB [Providencia rettgeri]MDK7744206.1 lipid asymmetry maintenance protein MlaB [Providencia rettgeri]MDK7756929.1 lipid asymmetry maintenance protein MlaB [Providencia rettgeri]HBC7429405.1 lipid asymmetry maintenance protein MlaB [Providencia rettgeri]
MSQLLAWELNETTLYLTGTLDRDSLMSFWDKKDSSLERIENIDVSGLKHVDSTGLAMLVRLKGEFQAKNRSLNITGVSDNLNTLIELYGVQEIILN